MRVYVITNQVNGHRYVGSEMRPDTRWRLHLFHLRAGTHHSPHLQNAFNKYGEDAFVCTTVEDNIPDNIAMLAREQHYIDAWNPEYNVCKIAGNTTGTTRTDETKAKMAESTRRAIAEGRLQPPSFLGHTQSPEAILKLRQANLGKSQPPAVRLKMRFALHGAPKTPEWRAAMSEMRKKLFAAGGCEALGIVVRYGRPVSEETKEKLRRARAMQVETPEATAKRMAAIAASRAAKGWVSGRKPVHGPELPPKPRKGHMLSEETKEKQRQAMVGRKMSPEARAKMSAAWAAKRAAKAAADAASSGVNP